MADAEVGRMKQMRLTLGAANAISTILLADNVRGVRLRPQGAVGSIAIYAVGEDPAAEGAGAFATGNFVVTGEAAEVRVPGTGDSTNSGKPRDLRVRSTVAALEILVETF